MQRRISCYLRTAKERCAGVYFKSDLKAVLMWHHLANVTMTIPLEKVLCTKYGNPLFLQQPFSNHVILPSFLSKSCSAQSHQCSCIIDPSPYAVLTFDTIFRNQSNQLSSKFIILRFSVTFWIRVVKQLLVSRVVSKSAVERLVHVWIKHESIFFCFSFLFLFKRFPVAVYLFLVVKQILTNPL